MNRHERRKRVRNATIDENFPDTEPHGPVQQEIRGDLNRVMAAIEPVFPGYIVTLLLAEKSVPAGQNRLPRFNYISSGQRADMIAVLEAFVAKQRAQGAKLDKVNDAPPTETRQ